MSKQLIVALSKGRILDETLPLLADAGIRPAEDLGKSRKHNREKRKSTKEKTRKQKKQKK